MKIDLFCSLRLDTTMWGEDVEQHDARLRQMLDYCHDCNHKLNNDFSCLFHVLAVRYVGHVLSAEGVKPDPQKVEAINVMPVPVNREDQQIQVHSSRR